MTEAGVRAPHTDGFLVEQDGTGPCNRFDEVSLLLTEDGVRHGSQPLIQAHGALPASSGARAGQGTSPQVTSRAVFTGGRTLSFGPFQLYPSQRLLMKGSRKVQLGSRAFDILTILVERAGELVGKDELIARVWPNIIVDSSNLKTQVSALRRALDESPVARRYIVVIPGRGYSFVAQVDVDEEPRLNRFS